MCIRALPALSVEYLGETADGKTAALGGAAAGVGVRERVAVEGADVVGAALAGRAVVDGGGLGAAGAAAAGVVVAAVAAAPAPHSDFRKSLYFWLLSVPAVFAAWYFTLHSFCVSALAGA